MTLTIGQWTTFLVAIAEIITGGVLWKLAGERLALQKERADWYKEKADEADKLKEEKKKLETNVLVVLKTQKDKDETIGKLSETLSSQKQILQFYQSKIAKLESDLTQLKSAQVNHPIQVSSTTATYSSLDDMLSGKMTGSVGDVLKL